MSPSNEEQKPAGELSALRKEVYEMRSLIIKTDNLLKTFHLELKDVAKRQEHYARRHQMTNVAGYVVIAALGTIFALTYGAASRDGAKTEASALVEQAKKTQAQADSALAEAKKDLVAQEAATVEAAAVWELLTSPDADKQDQGLVRAAKLDTQKLTGFARGAIEKTTREMREGRADKAFQTGLAEQKAGNQRAAREALERYLAIAEQQPRTWRASERLQAIYQLGAVCNALGDHEHAVPYLRTYLASGESAAGRAYAYLLLGDSLEGTRHTTEAQEAYRAGLALEPSGVTASLLKRRVVTDPPT